MGLSKKFFKGLSVFLSVLLAVNNFSFAADGIGYLREKSALRASSAGDNQAVTAELRGALKTRPPKRSGRQAFPVKIVEKKAGSVDQTREAGNAKPLADTLIVLSSIIGGDIAPFSQPLKVSSHPDAASASAAFGIFFEALKLIAEACGSEKSMTDPLKCVCKPILSAVHNNNISVQIVKDNDRLVDFAPISDDISNPQFGIRIDADLATELGITIDDNRLVCKDKNILRGAILLSAMSFLHEAGHITGMEEREAIHLAVDFYLGLSRDDRNLIREVLRTEKIDSGNTFNIFLAALTDTKLVDEIEGVDIKEFVNTPSAQLKKLAQELDAKQKLTETEKKKRKAIGVAYSWRDKQVSWLMLFERIDIPVDYENVSNIMQEAQRKRAAGEALNVDEYQMQLHEAVTASFSPETEDRNILAIARWANQNGICLVSGRLGRAFENQARMVSAARYVAISAQLREDALKLREAVSEIEALLNPAQRIVLLVSQLVQPSEAELEVAIKTFREAVIDYLAAESKRINEAKTAYKKDPLASKDGIKRYDAELTELKAKAEELSSMIEAFSVKFDEAKKKAAAFCFMIQRFVPAETHKYAKAVTFRDVDAGKEEDIRDLLRQGGHLAYCTPGQGKDLNVLMFMDHIIEAIPMLVKERIIRIQRPDGTYYDVTQAEVDQKGMEVFFRTVFAPYFLKNMRHAWDTQHIALARDILLKTAKYRNIAEHYGNLPFAQFMAVIDQLTRDKSAKEEELCQFAKDVVQVAALIDRSYQSHIREITEYRNKTGCDRLTAITDLLLKKETRITADANLVDKLLAKLEIQEYSDNPVKAMGDLWKVDFDNIKDRLAPYWDWRARRTPTLHDLTTQAPGLTEGYIETWIEEEMALIAILEDNPEVEKDVKSRTGTYSKEMIACAEQVLKEYGMEAWVEQVWNANNCRDRNMAVSLTLGIFPFLAEEAAKLAILREAKAEVNPEQYDKDMTFIDEVIKAVVALNGLTLQNDITAFQRDHQCEYKQAALAVIKADDGYREDFKNQRFFIARKRVIEQLDKQYPDRKLKERVKSFVRDHTALNLSTARKEAIAKAGLQHLILDPRYYISSEGPRKRYNLLYTPSRVNLGDRELHSVRVWSQAIGAKGEEAARAGYDFYRLINANPVVYLSPKIAEALKSAENGSKQSQTAFGHSIGMLLNFLGEGDAQRLLDEMMSRGDRMIPFPGEGYGGYCVPKDGLFLTFVIALRQEQKLTDMGVDVRFHQDIIELANHILADKPKFENEFEWEMWAAEFILKDHDQLKKFVDISTKGDSEEKILVFNITNLAKIIEGVGKPSPAIATGEKLLWNVLAEWSLDATILRAEQINRMMPFVKAWMILRSNPTRVNLTAEYKEIADSDKTVGDVRFSTGIRIFEILTGCCDHLIRQLGDEGQHIARLLRFGFDPDSKDQYVAQAAKWLMEKFNISEDDKTAIERFKKLLPYYEPPKDIVLTATSGVAVGDILAYTSDRQVSTDDIAAAVQRVLQEKPFELSDGQIAAASTAFGADLTQWPKLKDYPGLKELMGQVIQVKGLDGNIYTYPFKAAVHYLALKQRTLARTYQGGLQGCNVVNLGVVSGALRKVMLDPPRAVAFMLNGQPNEEPTVIDGPAGKTRDVSRAYMDEDVKVFFATCENWGLQEGDFASPNHYGKQGRYLAIGVGDNDVWRMRQKMHSQRQRALYVLRALQKAAATNSENDVREAEQALAVVEQDIIANNEAVNALKDEEMHVRWKKWQPRDRWLARTLSSLSSGLALKDLDFGTWLAMGGMYLLAGKSQKEIADIGKAFDKGIAAIRKSAPADKQSPLSLSDQEIVACVKALLVLQYQPEVAEFGQEKPVAISSKAIEAAATQARERRKALAKVAAVAKAQILTRTEYKATIGRIKDKAELAAAVESSSRLLSEIQAKAQAQATGKGSAADLETLNKSYGALIAYTREVFGILIDKYADRYMPGNTAKSRQMRDELCRNLDDVFGINGFNPKSVNKFLGGYESMGVIAVLAQAAGKDELDLVTDAIELFYSLYAIAQTIEYLQVPKGDVDLRMFWDRATVFFAETINDHYYEYMPWAYSRGSGYDDYYHYLYGVKDQTLKRPNPELYKIAADHHRWLYEYMRTIMVNMTDIADLPESEQNLLLGNYSNGRRIDAIGCDYERRPDGSALTEGEDFWRAYNQLREVTFIMNDGLAAMEIMKINPDLRKKGFTPNSKYPAPVVFDNFDPAVIDAANRVNMVLMFPVGRTHQSKLLRAGASCNAGRIRDGKPGLNVIISRYAPIEKVNGKDVVVLRDGQFYMSADEFILALQICKGYSKEAAERAVADLEKQGSIIDGRIRVAAKFSKPITTTSVVPHHHLPLFETGALEDAGIPATCQSLFSEWHTYDKSLYAAIIEGSGVNMPAEIRWRQEWTDLPGTEEERIQRLINGYTFTVTDPKTRQARQVEFKGLRAFAKELAAKGEEPIIIVKGAAESGARNQKVFLAKARKDATEDEVLEEMAKFVLMVSRTPQNVVIQKVIRINPEFWASEDLMNEFVDRRIMERSSAVVRTKYPRTPYYCSFRVVPSSSDPSKPYAKTSGIVVMNTEIATNVGRGGSLEPLIRGWMQEQYADVLVSILNKNAEAMMKAMNNFGNHALVEEFKKKYGRDIGKDALGTPYSWMPFALLDFLAEPVFEKEGKIVDIEPRYDASGKRIGSKVILEDENGNRFEGKVKEGEAGWRVYMIEPNTGIGQIDRRTLRMEELETKKAAKEDKPVDWAAIEQDDHIILNDWADRGVAYGGVLFGPDFFRPSPAPSIGITPPAVTLEDYLRMRGETTQAQTVLQRAMQATRDALGLKETEAIDETALSVLIKYYVVEQLIEENELNIEQLRRNILQGKTTLDDLVYLSEEELQQKILQAEEVLLSLCQNGLSVTGERLHKILKIEEGQPTSRYINQVVEIIRAHFLTAWTGMEVEVMPEGVTREELFGLMPGKRHILAHVSLDNPAAPNETFALMLDSDVSESDIAVIGIDQRNITAVYEGELFAPCQVDLLAYVQLTGQDRKRLVKVRIAQDSLHIDAIWKDETCPLLDTTNIRKIVDINPKEVSDTAHDKAATLLLLAKNGINIPRGTRITATLSDSQKRELIRGLVKSITAAPDIQTAELFISPNTGTQGIGTKRFVVPKAAPDSELDAIVAYINRLGCDAIVRAGVGKVRYFGDDGKTYKIDFRLNVVHSGGDLYETDSAYATVATDPDADTSSVNKGGKIISILEALKRLCIVEPNGKIQRVDLDMTQLSIICREACNALMAVNQDRPESQRLLFGGVDMRLDITDAGLTPYILEVNPQAAGLRQSHDLIAEFSGDVKPKVASPIFWRYINQRIESREGPKASSAGRADLRGVAELNSPKAVAMPLNQRVAELQDAFLGRYGRSLAGKNFKAWVFDRSIWDEAAFSERLPKDIDPQSNPLLYAVSEHAEDAEGRVTQVRKLNLGLFYLARKLAAHPEMVDAMHQELDAIKSNIRQKYGSELEYLIWPGMGGSAEDKYLCEACGVYDNGRVKVFILDDTDPASLQGILDQMIRSEKLTADRELSYDEALASALKKTLVMVQALGMTSYEPVVNARDGLQPLYDYYKLDGKLHFRGMTIDGSHLDKFMQAQHYTRLRHQPDGKATLSGRHDGPLSYGCLIPLMLNGVDIESWIRQTQLSAKETEKAMELAAWVVANVERGRNKIILRLPKEWQGAGLWIKQLFEESLGKKYDFGLKIIITEDSSDLTKYETAPRRADTCLLWIGIEGLTNGAVASRGTIPIFKLNLEDMSALKANVLPAKLMQMLHYAVFPIAYCFDVCAVDQPPVENYKGMVEFFQAQKGLGNQPMWHSFSSQYTATKDGITLHGWPMIAQGEKEGAITSTELREAISAYRGVRGFDPADPAHVYAALHLLASQKQDTFGKPAVRYGGFAYYGDMSRTKDGRAMRSLLSSDARSFYTETMGIPTDIGKGPGHNHSYHAMDVAWRHGFMTAIMPKARVEIPHAENYPGDYLTMQYFATILALDGYKVSSDKTHLEWAGANPGFVVGITINNPDEANRQALADFFDRAGKMYTKLAKITPAKSSSTGFEASVEAMTSTTFNTSIDFGWGITDLNQQKAFCSQFMSTLDSKPEAIRDIMVSNYLHWLLATVFPKMQQLKDVPDYANRLWPNELMKKFIIGQLEGYASIYPNTKPAFEKAINKPGALSAIILALAENNDDVYYRFFTDLASREALGAAVTTMGEYIDREMALPLPKATTETVCAIMADIHRHYLNDTQTAEAYEAKIKKIDSLLYDAYKRQLLNAKPKTAVSLAGDGHTTVFFGVVPNRICWSSASGSDARYNIMLDPEGGFAVNAPAVFSDYRGGAATTPVAIVQRTSKPGITLRAISNMVTQRPIEVVIDGKNIRDLYCPRDGKAFGDIKGPDADPLSFLKYALFFSGIIGSGIDAMPGNVISSEEKAQAKENPMALAKLYFERCPEEALADITRFMRGGGIEITCDNHSSPVSAGFSTSSSASIGALTALYGISGQEQFIYDTKLCCEMALIMENDLGRGTGPQDTTGVLAGAKNLTYAYEQGAVIERIEDLRLPQEYLNELSRRTLILTPAVPRAASTKIGERQIKYLLREPDRFAALLHSKVQHRQIVQALREGRFAELGGLMWHYMLNRQKVHDVLPAEMQQLFEDLLDKGLIHGGELAGSMGPGASAILIAADFGLETVTDQRTGEVTTRLEAALRDFITPRPYFRNAATRYMQIPDKGPRLETERLYPMRINIAETEDDMGEQAARGVFESFKRRLQENQKQGKDYAVINFAAAPSQDAYLKWLVRLFQEADTEYQRIYGVVRYYSSRLKGVHPDEYEGMTPDYPASFCTYLKEYVAGPLGLKSVKGDIQNSQFFFVSDYTPEEYMQIIGELGGIDITTAGIGENGHLGFNDPPADFMAEGIIRVRLARECRVQQIHGYPQYYNPANLRLYDEGKVEVTENMEKVLKGGEGIGPGVPQFAWIMTARTMLSAKEVFVIVPSPATQHVVAALCRNGVNPNITATLLYTHPKVSLYLDNASAELLTPADIARATQPVAIPAAVKASSAGAQEPRNVTDITVQYAQQMAHANANFRQALQGISASTSQSPDVDAQAAISFLKDASHQLGQAIDAYRQIKATAQNPQDVSAAAFNLQYATDTVRTVDSVLYAGSNKEMRAEFNLVIEKTPQTQEQFDMARSIGEIDKIKELLGCNIICADTGEITALQAQGVNPANTIVVTATQAGANNFAVFKRMIDLKNLNTGQYLNLTALSLLAKGLYLIDKVDTASVSRIKNAIQTAYRNLTGNALPTADLDRYVASPAEFIIEVILGHDVGVAYEKGELENLHRQAFAVLIAA